MFGRDQPLAIYHRPSVPEVLACQGPPTPNSNLQSINPTPEILGLLGGSAALSYIICRDYRPTY